MRGFGIAALAFLVAAAFAAATWLWTPTPRKFDAAAAREAAAAYDARIIRDAFGVPHIYGARNADVAFGLAYAHAEDDWPTIEERLNFSRGELGRVAGRSGAITDYLVKAMGVRETVAEKMTKDLSPETLEILEGYAAGANYYCAEKAGRCSPGIAPVTAAEMVEGFVARQPFFYGLDGELQKLLSPPEETGEASAAAGEGARLASAVRDFYRVVDGHEFGSNAIAISPKRSADGATRLMVNSHQPYTGSVAWYEARVKSDEGWDAIGGVFPGTPFILHGTTPNLGWAFTVNKPDLVDVFTLTVDDEKRPTKYRFDGDWRDFEEGAATFRVKLFGPFSLPVKRRSLRSVHGPVFETPTGWAAVSFAGDGDVRAVEQYRRMNMAQTYDDWRGAAELLGIPSLNAVYADRTGRIAYFYNAAIPLRSPDIDWTRPAPGDASSLVWAGVRGFDEVPQVVDPASGYVGNANNGPFEASAPEDAPRSEDFPPHYGIDRRTTNRGGRLTDLYLSDDSITEEEFIAYKMDDAYGDGSQADVFVKTAVAAIEADADLSAELVEEAAILKGWDRRSDRANRAAALSILATLAYLDRIDEGAGETAETSLAAVREAAEDLRAGFGRIDPEWGDVNRLVRGDVSLPLDGGPDTLRAVYGAGDASEGPLKAAAGDTYVMAIGWDADGAQTIKTIHQFGSATLDETSPHYADQAILFADKKWKTPPMSLDALLAEATRDYRAPAK